MKLQLPMTDQNFESTSAAKDFLSPDGLLDFKKIDALSKKVEKEAKAYVPTLKLGRKDAPDTITGVHATTMREVRALVGKGAKITKAKDGSFTVVTANVKDRGLLKTLSPANGTAVKPLQLLAIGVRAKVEMFNGPKNRKGNQFTYLGRRACNVVTRTKETDKMRVFVRQYPKGVLSKATEKSVGEVFKALAMHQRNAVKVKAKIQKERGVIKDEKSKNFSVAGDELKAILVGAGLKENMIVSGKTMMGAQSLFIKLPKTKQVISIAVSDVKAMNAAKKASLAES